jgi:hypothetical protein
MSPVGDSSWCMAELGPEMQGAASFGGVEAALEL